ncbi:hypothetical protein ACQY0O_006244 [Thecaphora frezii]
MAQGFKPSKPAASALASKNKAKSKVTKTGPKRGPRVIAPKKAAAVSIANQKKKQTASLTSKIEQEMAGRAASGGPLTIMKKAADGALEAQKRDKKK